MALPLLKLQVAKVRSKAGKGHSYLFIKLSPVRINGITISAGRSGLLRLAACMGLFGDPGLVPIEATLIVPTMGRMEQPWNLLVVASSTRFHRPTSLGGPK